MSWQTLEFSVCHQEHIHVAACNAIMAYGSTPYVGMTLKKNGSHIKSAQMTHLKFVC